MRINEKGITLVEVLAMFVIFSIISLFAFDAIFSLTKNNEKLTNRYEVYSDANILSQVVLNEIYNMKLEKSSKCGTNCYNLINRGKISINGNGDTEISPEIIYVLEINSDVLKLTDNTGKVLVSQPVDKSSSISSTCSNTCFEAVITLELYFELDNQELYQSITTIAH